MTKFVGIVHKDNNSDYGVSFPDFPGCISAGDSLEEAYGMATEALEAHLQVMREMGAALPRRARTLDEVVKHPQSKGAATFFLIEAHLPSRTVRINVTMDEGLLHKIDKIAGNRSAFLARAAEKLLHETR